MSPHETWPDGNPLRSNSPESWARLVDALGPAALLVAIEGRMSARLRRRVEPEDILSEALLRAWRERERLEWRGLRSFRAWLLQVAVHQITDAAEREGAVKRGGGREIAPLSALAGAGSRADETSAVPVAIATTTPSRVAAHRELADAMRAALDRLPEDLRDVIRLRVIEELSVEEVAERLDLGVSAVKHRSRKGSAEYHRLLRAHLDSVSHESPRNPGTG